VAVVACDFPSPGHLMVKTHAAKLATAI